MSQQPPPLAVVIAAAQVDPKRVSVVELVPESRFRSGLPCLPLRSIPQYANRHAELRVSVPHELAVNVNLDETKRHVYVLAIVERSLYDEITSPVARPGGLVAPDGRPVATRGA